MGPPSPPFGGSQAPRRSPGAARSHDLFTSTSAVGDHHGDREPVVNLAVYEPRLDAEGVVGERGSEDRADLVVVARIREGACDQRLHLALQAIPGQARLG